MYKQSQTLFMDYGKIVTLDDLQAISSEGGFRPAGAVADAMAGMLGEAAAEVALPSLMALAGFYGCTHLDIYDALRILKSRGCDYRLRGIDAPLVVWRIS